MAILEGNNPKNWGFTITIVANYLLNRMILQVAAVVVGGGAVAVAVLVVPIPSMGLEKLTYMKTIKKSTIHVGPYTIVPWMVWE